MPLDFGAIFGGGAAGGSCGGESGEVTPASAGLPAVDTVYGTADCPWCMRTKAWLTGRNVRFVWRDVDDDPAADAEAVQVSGQDGLPVVVLRGRVIVGYEPAAMDRALRGR